MFVKLPEVDLSAYKLSDDALKHIEYVFANIKLPHDSTTRLREWTDWSKWNGMTPTIMLVIMYSDDSFLTLHIAMHSCRVENISSYVF